MPEPEITDPPLTQTAPRELPEIEKEYAVLCTEAGKCHYQVEVYKTKLGQITDNLFRVNKEAANRRILNQQQEAAKNAVTQ